MCYRSCLSHLGSLVVFPCIVFPSCYKCACNWVQTTIYIYFKIWAASVGKILSKPVLKSSLKKACLWKWVFCLESHSSLNLRAYLVKFYLVFICTDSISLLWMYWRLYVEIWHASLAGCGILAIKIIILVVSHNFGDNSYNAFSLVQEGGFISKWAKYKRDTVHIFIKLDWIAALSSQPHSLKYSTVFCSN